MLKKRAFPLSPKRRVEEEEEEEKENNNVINRRIGSDDYLQTYIAEELQSRRAELARAAERQAELARAAERQAELARAAERLQNLRPKCPICLEPLTNDRTQDGEIINQVKFHPCGHFAHEDCITDRIHKGDHCPLCRTVIGSIEDEAFASGMKRKKNRRSAHRSLRKSLRRLEKQFLALKRLMR